MRSIHAYRRTLSADRRRLLDRYRYVDAARKVVGVGSVGTRAWIMLLLGGDEDDPLFLQLKEAEASVLEPFLGKSGFSNHGQRVVEGQRLTQAASDIMLGWLRTSSASTASSATSTCANSGMPRAQRSSSLWSRALSRPTPRCAAGRWPEPTPARGTPSPRKLPRHQRRFDRAIASFAETYADQNERDYRQLIDAAKTGVITARSGI